MEYLPINDLPNEVLEIIFDQLDVDDLKDASRVCKRWSDLAFLGRRIDRVTLVLNFPWDKTLLLSNRKYRHLKLSETEKDFAYVKKVLQTFNVSSLRLEDFGMTLSSLRLMLLEVPNLQHLYLSIVAEPDQTNQVIESFPVMKNLKYLEIGFSTSDSSLPWHTIAPSLQGLKMDCQSEAQLEQWRLFSGQLKQVDVTFHEDNAWDFFCEMAFPLLEELTMKSFLDWDECEALDQRHALLTRHEFFRRNTNLRRLRLEGIYLSKTLVQDITNHNKKLAFLDVIGDYEYESKDNGEEGSLESLVQLTEIKHLRLNNLNADIFYGCEALPSLQSLSINNVSFNHKGTLGFLEDLFKIAPQLRCLELDDFKMSESAAQFICKNFTNLTRLQLTYSEEESPDGLSEIDWLPHLSYLQLNLITINRFFIGIVRHWRRQNNVRYLSLHLPNECDEDELLRLPEIFPQLNRLNLISRSECLRKSTVDKLRQLLPTCAIILYGYIITSEDKERSFRKWARSQMIPWEEEWKFYHRGELF